MVSAPISPPEITAEAHAKASSLPLRVLECWHLLSLDAPTVAMVWSWAYAQAAGVRLHPLSTALLGLATWLLYVADRLLDGMQPSHTSSLKERHYFHARHRVAFTAIAVPVAGLLFWLVLTRMDHAPRLEDLLLSAGAGIYLLCVHLPATRVQSFPKEAAVAVIFTVACVIPAWSRQASAHSSLACAAIPFAGLCWLNCIAIEHWEAGNGDRLHSATRLVGKNLVSACMLLAFAALLAALVAFSQKHPDFAGLFLSMAASAFLLLQLDRTRSRIAPLQLRAAADAVLLAPLAFLLMRSLSHHL